MTSQSKLFSALRQLVSSGIPGKAIMPEIIHLLRLAVGFDFAGVCYFGDRFEVEDVLIPPVMDRHLVEDYVENFHNRPEGDGLFGMTSAQLESLDRNVLHSSNYTDKGALVSSEFWNRILSPVGIGWTCRLPLKVGGKLKAILIVARPFGNSDFSSTGIDALNRAHPWLCHGMAAKRDVPPVSATPPAPVSGLFPSSTGIITLDNRGQIVMETPGAINLLLQAASGRLASATPWPQAQELCKTLTSWLDKALSGKTGPLPGLRIDSPQGVFYLRAYAMAPSMSPPRDGWKTLYIERRVAMVQLLFSSEKFIALPTRERDVCLALLEGLSAKDIAARLGVKESSANYYIKLLYRRLGVEGYKSLAATLIEKFL